MENGARKMGKSSLSDNCFIILGICMRGRERKRERGGPGAGFIN
jgi:hypothetical protein